MGSVPWMPPEVLLDATQFTTKSDVYSFAILCWEVFAKGVAPFNEISHYVLADKVINQNYRPEIPDNCPTEWSNLIMQCWSQNSDTRPTFQQIVDTLNSWNDPPKIIQQRRSLSASSHVDEFNTTTILIINEEEESFNSNYYETCL